MEGGLLVQTSLHYLSTYHSKIENTLRIDNVPLEGLEEREGGVEMGVGLAMEEETVEGKGKGVDWGEVGRMTLD
jgi:hypothetical protein